MMDSFTASVSVLIFFFLNKGKIDQGQRTFDPKLRTPGSQYNIQTRKIF